MLENLQVQPFRSKVYTVKQIDEHLYFISQIILLGDKKHRSTAFRRADNWLDMRIEICPPQR